MSDGKSPTSNERETLLILRNMRDAAHGGSGDAWEDAWTRFERHFQPWLLRQTMSRLNMSKADAEDMVQEVFLKLLEHPGLLLEFEEERPGGFRAWLFTVLRNAYLKGLRNRRGVEPVVETLPDPRAPERPPARMPVSPEPEAARLQEMIVQALGLLATDVDTTWRNCVARLGEEVLKVKETFGELRWQAFVLTALDGRDIKSVATQLGLKPSRVSDAKYDILKKFRDCFPADE